MNTFSDKFSNNCHVTITDLFLLQFAVRCALICIASKLFLDYAFTRFFKPSRILFLFSLYFTLQTTMMFNVQRCHLVTLNWCSNWAKRKKWVLLRNVCVRASLTVYVCMSENVTLSPLLELKNLSLALPLSLSLSICMYNILCTLIGSSSLHCSYSIVFCSWFRFIKMLCR